MLTNLTIQNFKSLLEAQIPLGGLTLLTGVNGVGKSTVIQVLLLLQQSIRDGEFRKGLFLKDDEGISLGIGRDVFSIASEKDAMLEFGLEWEDGDWLELAFKQESDKDVLPFVRMKKSDSSHNGEKVLLTSRIHYLSANRINPQTQYRTSAYHVDELASLGKEGEFTVHFLAKNQNKPLGNPALQHPLAKSDTLLDNVSAWMSEIAAGVKVDAIYHEMLELASLSYRFEMENGYTEGFKPTNVGFGLTYALPIVTSLLMLPKGSLLIVENPESHLHPAGQSKIAQLCARAVASGVQVVLESHSDHILNGIRVAVKQGLLPPTDVQVLYFSRSVQSPDHSSNITPIFLDADGRADEWPEGFFDEMDNQLRLLL